jgi:hypothetical protein
VSSKSIRDLGFLFILLYIIISITIQFFGEVLFDSYSKWNIYGSSFWDDGIYMLFVVISIWIIPILRKTINEDLKDKPITNSIFIFLITIANISILSLILLLIPTKDNQSGEDFEDIFMIQQFSFLFIYFIAFSISKYITNNLPKSINTRNTVEKFLESLLSQVKKNDK